ncbi:MAG: CoA ester lyase [Aggregatilineales bacterium]
MSYNPRRALLFMPADDLHKISKAAALGVDCIVMDLEDSVAPDRKNAARQTAAQALQSLTFGRTERLVRLNPLNTAEAEADLRAVLPASPDGFVIPKAEDTISLSALSARLATFEREAGLPQGKFTLLAIIETARGMVALREIAASTPRLSALIFGAEDYTSSIGAQRTRGGTEVLYARSAVVMHAAAAQLQAIDTLFTDLEDMDGLQADAAFARQLGFTGKLAIHPKQVPIIQAAFTPSESEIAAAERLLAAYKANQAVGIGVFAHEGKMVDMPMIKAAQNVLMRAGKLF